MPISFTQQRIESLGAWAKAVEIPGMDPDTYVAIFSDILNNQKTDGSWVQDPNKRWAVVMTAVVLQALSALKFNIGDWWPTKSGPDGGIKKAVDFLTSEVSRTGGRPDAIGEDVWDACQAALALKAFGAARDAEQVVTRINSAWKSLYDNAPRGVDTNEWCGPAYLAAMVDVIREYEESPKPNGPFSIALAALQSEESKDEQNKPLGYFASIIEHDDIDIWNTSLVLRTLSMIPKECEALVDREQVQRVAVWLLDRLDRNAWRLDGDRAPMFLARGLHGLLAARPWTDSTTRQRTNKKLEWGNKQLAEYFRAKQGNLKSYTAVVEYLSNWTVSVSAGLAFHARNRLMASAFARSEPAPREGGLRIAWLSDLHVAAPDETRPSLGIVKRCARWFMWQKGTPLTAHFPLRNMETILDRVKELKPDHILVTGDLTDFAQRSQFESVSNRFLSVQTAIRDGNIIGDLDPSLWTILPGNHDVTDEESGDDPVRPTLARFFHFFARTFGLDPGASYGTAFPLTKSLRGKDGALSVRLIGLDSTVIWPVWAVGINARGRIDPIQLNSLNKKLNEQAQGAITLIALHHHPIVVPDLLPAMQDYFLSLNESDGRQLVQAAANLGVSAILHGHFHRFSSWSGLAPTGRNMAIVGSAAGTLEIPGTKEEFLELREAVREMPTGLQQGLAIYAQRLVNNAWMESYTGIFLPKA
jgi:3',5'-cyclic-AMP phosphodiesterase